MTRETDKTRETSLLEITTLVLKQQITEFLREPGMEDIIDDLAVIRASEIVRTDKNVKYADTEAFTCEISTDKIFITKHPSVDKAIRYALSNIGEISIVYQNNIVVFGGITDSEAFWTIPNKSDYFRIKMTTPDKKEVKSWKGLEYTVENVD